ncbi:MAG: RDD family protein [Hyphomicrobiales bacterium]|nr:RDD family protein [Hyphomicrobiales bacterium]
MDEEILFNGEETGNHEMRSNYSEVRRRRVLAFIVDYIIIAILCVPAAALIGFAGILTFGLGWILYAAMVPLVVFAYLGLTMGGENQATIGMSMFSIHIRRLDGCIVDAPLAILHGILFWFLHSVLSPFMLLASLFSSRKRLLQDWLLGTEVVYRDHG